MINRCFLMFALLVAGLCAAQGDTVQLKDKSAVTGKILAEKSDSIVVDIGYTVLVIPRNQISTTSKNDDAPQSTKVAAKPKAGVETSPVVESRSGFYLSGGKSTTARTVRELVNEIGESVVQVRTPGGLGSGFFINDEGFLITNFHVIEGETKISVEVYHQKNGQLEPHSYKDVRIVAINKFQDVALLKIEDKDAPKFKFIPLGDSDRLAVGDPAFAIGSPLGLERTVTEGIISTKTREFQGDLYLQTTAQINPGNSGGPLFNMLGEVVGVTNMKLTTGEGLGFAIPIETVKYFLDHRDGYTYSNDNPSNPYRYLEPPSHIRQNQ